MKFAFSKKYFLLAIALFIVEVLIGAYMHDRFIRPYVGDFLVVILLYCLVKSFIQASATPVAIAVLVFSYIVEVLQYFNMVKLLGLQDSKMANILLGNHFAWEDILAYTLGTALVLIAEKATSSS